MRQAREIAGKAGRPGAIGSEGHLQSPAAAVSAVSCAVRCSAVQCAVLCSCLRGLALLRWQAGRNLRRSGGGRFPGSRLSFLKIQANPIQSRLSVARWMGRAPTYLDTPAAWVRGRQGWYRQQHLDVLTSSLHWARRGCQVRPGGRWPVGWRGSGGRPGNWNDPALDSERGAADGSSEA